MFDVSSASRRACQAVLFDKIDTAKMHGLVTSNVSCTEVTWRAKWNLGLRDVKSTSPCRQSVPNI